MQSNNVSPSFMGTMPEMYDRGMGPVMFEPYAIDMASGLPTAVGLRVLEIAAGTGQVTRQLLKRLPEDGHLTVTDLSPDMLAYSQSYIDDPRIHWQIADAQALPFGDRTQDVVVCGFGMMFLPDKAAGYREAYRVLKPGGVYRFSVWGSFERNPWAGVCHHTLQALDTDNPIPFMTKPFSYHDQPEIVQALTDAGFGRVRADWNMKEFIADSAGAFALAVATGTPVLTGIQERNGDVDKHVHAIAEAFRANFGDHPMQSTMSALMIEAVKD